MARENEIIIEVEVNAGESAERLAEIRARLDELQTANRSMRREQKELNATLAAGGTLTAEQGKRLKEVAETMAKNTAEIKELTAAEKMETAQVQIATQNDRKYGDSIVELGAQLAQLKAEYRGLSKAQRESAEGKELLKNIQQLDEAVKEADYSLGDHQRNVGNYVSALTGLNGNVLKVANLFAGGFRQGLSAAGAAVKAFGKTLLATPLGWITAAVGAVVAVFRQLQAAFQRNDEAGTKLQAAFQRLSPVVTMIKNGFNALANVVAGVVDVMSRAAAAVVGFFVPASKAMGQAAAEAAVRLDELEQAERDYLVASAERANERAKLEERARYAEGLTSEERVALLEKSRDLALEDLKEDRRIKKEKLDLLLEEQKRTADYSDAMADRIAEARAGYINSETEMIQGTRRLNSQLKSEREALEREAAAAAREAAQRRAERLRAEREAFRAAEDLSLELMAEGLEKSRRQVEQAYARQVEDLKARLKEERGLTLAARESLNEQLRLLEEKRQRDLDALDEAAAAARRQSLEKINEEVIAARIAAIEDETERAVAAERNAAERRVSELRKRLEEEKELTLEERRGINELIEREEAASAARIAEIQSSARREALRRGWEELQQEMDNGLREALLAAGENARAAADVTLAAAEQSHARLLAMDAETKAALFQNEETYKAAVLQSEGEIAAARAQSQAALQEQARQVGDTMKSVTGAMSAMFEAVAGDTEEYENFKKAMAIVDALISMATTIASATAASTAGDPYTMAIRIAANVAAVTAQFASVIAAIKAATVPSAPKFERGGIVPGTSWNGDRVPALLNSGEMVINRQDQQRLFDMITSGVVPPLNVEMMRAAFREAVAELPPPVLGLREFAAFERRVRLSENLTKL